MITSPYIARKTRLDRRTFLRGAGGACLGLPFLEAMIPAFAARGATIAAPKRLVAMSAGLGFHAPFLFPSQEGKDVPLTPYLEKIKAHRDKMTLLSGLSHPEQQGASGHSSQMTWLTSAKHPGLAGFRNSISLDQLIANEIGGETRLPYLALAVSGNSLSWTSNGVEIPAEGSPSRLFQKMFLQGDQRAIADEMRRLKRGRSILDTVGARARRLEAGLGERDREKLDEYLTSVRDLEIRLQQSQNWAVKPKPRVEAAPPKDIEDRQDAIAQQRLMYEMIVLALQTDSTRTITFSLGGMNAVPSNIPGVENDWHNLSHHGRDDEKIAELKLIELAEFEAFNDFLTRLRDIDDQGTSLLDHTAVLFGSNLGNASAHDWRNLPIIVAGGGFKPNGYVAHDEKNNTPLSNLFVTLAQHMGIGIDSFGSSTAAGVRGLES